MVARFAPASGRGSVPNGTAAAAEAPAFAFERWRRQSSRGSPQPARRAALSPAPLVRRASGNGAMAYTLSEAAKAAGKGKTTLLRMIRSGRLSATRDPVTDGWLIEPAELHRLYPPVHHNTAEQIDHGAPRIAALEARLEAAETRIRDKDEMIVAHRAEIDDLRQQRDQAHQQLAMALGQIAALLTDQRPAVPARRWWRGWLWRRV